MNNELKIEYYLSQLDRELQSLTVSERAEIITEIKSHITETIARDAAKPVDTILSDLGTPRQVAERYLVSKGKPLAPRRRTGKMFKWLAIGTVGFFALIFFAGIMAAIYLRPFVHVDQEKGRVTLLGGLIDVNEEIGEVRIGDLVVNDDMTESVKIKGEEDLSGKDVKFIKIPFNTAKIDVKHATGKTFSWECKAATAASELAAEISAGVLTLNLDKLNLAKCAIELPIGAAVEFRGVNGHMDIDYPFSDVDIAIDNGKVNIHPDPSRVYDFEVKVKNGLKDFFPRSKEKDAVKVKVSVVNGVVKKE
jgi:hypothetical protein